MKRWPRWLAITVAGVFLGMSLVVTAGAPALAANTGLVSCSDAGSTWHRAAVPLIPVNGQPTRAQLAKAQPLKPGDYIALGPDQSGRSLAMCYVIDPAANSVAHSTRYFIHRLGSSAATRPVPGGSYIAISAGSPGGDAVLFRAPATRPSSAKSGHPSGTAAGRATPTHGARHGGGSGFGTKVGVGLGVPFVIGLILFALLVVAGRSSK
jgi:hypothetical protein